MKNSDLLEILNKIVSQEKLAVGACCVNGECSIMPPQYCEALGGEYQGNHSSCNPDPCNGVGACCYDDGSCQDNMYEGDCVSSGGSYQGKSTVCADVDCGGGQPPVGACCNGDSCSITTELKCSGDYLGNYTDCSGDPCMDIWDKVGACCHDDFSCSQTTEDLCQPPYGSWAGEGVSCEEADCGPQPSTGACCLDDGSCETNSEDACLLQGGSYSGDDTTCDDVTCPQPTGSCCGFTENIDGEEEYGCEDDLTFLECLKGSALNKPRSWLEDSLCSEIDCNINNEYLRDGFVFGCGDCLENSPDGCCCFIGSGDTPTHGGVTFATIPHYKFWNTGCSNEGPTAFIDDQNEPWCQDGGCEEASFYIKGYPCINFCPEGKQLLTQCGGWYRALDLSIKPISWDCISGSNGQPCPKCIGPPHSERGSIAFIMNRIAKNLKNKP